MRLTVEELQQQCERLRIHVTSLEEENGRLRTRTNMHGSVNFWDSMEHLRLTLNEIAHGVIITDMHGTVQQINTIAGQLCDCSPRNAVGQLQSEVFSLIESSTMEVISLPYQQCATMASADGGQALLRTQGAHHIWIEYTFSVMHDDTGGPFGAVIVLSDISREKQLEEQLRQSQKMDAIGQLAGGIAHDFNNMLAGIIGAAELLSMGEQQVTQDKSCVDLIMDTATRAAELTSKLLSFSRKGKMVNTKVDMHAVILDAVGILERSIDKRVVVGDDLYADRPDVRGDPTQLLNVILNLGLNARDAISDVGEINIHTENIELDADFCTSNVFDIRPGHYLQISVRDSGIGINEEDRAHIFEPFFTTKDFGKGTGLGLAAVYGSMCDHEGAVTVYSEPHQGSVFNIYLPSSDAADAATDVPDESELSSGEAMCVLVVDDESIIRMTAQTILERMGYEVLLAENGVQAIHVFKQHYRRIDVVLLDVVMPEMNGQDCYRSLRNIDPLLRAVVCSGFPKDAMIESMKKEGAVEFLKKPYMSAHLMSAIRSVLQL